MVGARVSHSSEADLSCASSQWQEEITTSHQHHHQQLRLTLQPTLLTHGLARTLPPCQVNRRCTSCAPMRCCNPTLPTSKPRPLVRYQGTSSHRQLTSSLTARKGQRCLDSRSCIRAVECPGQLSGGDLDPLPLPNTFLRGWGSLFPGGGLVSVTPTLSEISWFCQIELNNSFHKLSEWRPEAGNRKLRYGFQSMHQ